MLEGCDIRLGVDYFENKAELDLLANKVLFTGCIDEYYGFCFGELEYRTVRFETEVIDKENYQGVAVMNYTDAKTPYTRIIEHKHFEYGTQPKTVISKEYSTTWVKGMEPYYPVNNDKNAELFEKYQSLAKAETKVVFGGRLGEYKYYDMDKVIRSALDKVNSL